MITLDCSCGKQHQLKPQMAGKRIRCVGCQQDIQVPAPTAPPEAPAAATPVAKPRVVVEVTAVSPWKLKDQRAISRMIKSLATVPRNGN